MLGRPMKIVVFAPFAAGIGQRPGRSTLLQGDLSVAAEALGENCVLEIPRELVDSGRIAIPLLPPHGLEPDAWLQREPQLAALAQAQAFLQAAEEQKQPPEILAEQLCRRWPELRGGWQTFSTAQGRQAAADDPLGGLLDLVDLPGQHAAHHVQRSGATLWREELEDQLRAILSHVIRQPAYQQRVAAWRGVSWLQQLASDQTCFKLIDVDRQSLAEVLAQVASELEQEAPDLLLVDLPFDLTPRDQETLARLAELAEGLLAPTLIWLDAQFFGLENWRELARLPFLKNHLEQPQFAKWRSLCAKPAARWVTACVGRFAAAASEQSDATHWSRLALAETSWISPIWAAAALALQQRKKHGFPCPLTGQTIAAPFNGSVTQEVSFSDDRHFQLLRCGLAPLILEESTRIGFTAVPPIGGGSLDQQLFLRQLLSWLFVAQDQKPLTTAAQLQDSFLAQLKNTGIEAPEDLSFAESAGQLSVHMTPPVALVPAAEPISLQLPWS